jgi:hypothetical protein
VAGLSSVLNPLLARVFNATWFVNDTFSTLDKLSKLIFMLRCRCLLGLYDGT